MELLIFILILVALIVVHEFGHFFAAKFFKIRVDEFGIGFPPRLIAKKFGETVYSLNVLFFGGFVKIFGENEKEGGVSERSFANKPKIVQAIVIAAGVICNVIFAWIILSAGYMYGLPTSREHQGVGEVTQVETLVVGVLPGSPADLSGIKAGESIESIATAASAAYVPKNAEDAQEYIRLHQDESLIIHTSAPDGESKTFIVQAKEGLIEGRKAVGVQLDDVGILQLTPHLALVQGALLTYHMTTATAVGLFGFFSQIFRGAADFSSVAGPIGIATIGAEAVGTSVAQAVTLTALISINLAIINLLPIPGLDGGRLFVIAIEALTRRKVSEKAMFYLSLAGFGFLILLMIIVSYHDIVRIIG